MIHGARAPGSMMDPIFGRPVTAVGSRGIPGGLDAMFGFSEGSGIDGPQIPGFSHTTGIMGKESSLEQTANATTTVPVPFKVNDVTSDRLDMNTGEQMLVFRRDAEQFRMLMNLREEAVARGGSSNNSVYPSLTTVVDGTRDRDFFDAKAPHHQESTALGLSRLNYFLRSEMGRRLFGPEKTSKWLNRVFKWMGVQETQLLPEHRVRTEQTMSVHIRGIARFANVWLACGLGLPAQFSELYLVPIRLPWTGLDQFPLPSTELDKAKSALRDSAYQTAHPRLDDFKDGDDAVMSAAGKGWGMQFELSAVDQMRPLYDVAGLAAAAAAPTKHTEFYWQYTPVVAPSCQMPPRKLYHNLSYTSKPEHIGTTLDHYGTDAPEVNMDTRSPMHMARDAIYPAEDGDGYKNDYYKLDRIEVNLRSKRVWACRF